MFSNSKKIKKRNKMKENLTNLVGYFFDFVDQAGYKDPKDFDIVAFAEWLIINNAKSSEGDNTTISRDLCFLITRFNKFSKNYIKIAFNNLPLSTLEEYWVLNAVFENANLNKNEIYELTLVDVPIGAKIIQRLLAYGLIKELPDKIDKRMKRLKITPNGTKVRNEAFQEISKNSVLSLGKINIDEKLKLIEKFNYLDTFNSKVLREATDEPISKLLDKHINN